jgi:hypothetical protein
MAQYYKSGDKRMAQYTQPRISTRASDYSTGDEISPYEEKEQPSQYEVAYKAVPAQARCASKPKRVLKSPQVTVPAGFTQDLHGEDMRRQALMQRVRELAAQSNN